jgi:hypothetical protein
MSKKSENKKQYPKKESPSLDKYEFDGVDDFTKLSLISALNKKEVLELLGDQFEAINTNKWSYNLERNDRFGLNHSFLNYDLVLEFSTDNKVRLVSVV